MFKVLPICYIERNFPQRVKEQTFIKIIKMNTVFCVFLLFYIGALYQNVTEKSNYRIKIPRLRSKRYNYFIVCRDARSGVSTWKFQ